ncbi:hypothetical protein QOL99_13090 [Deinococcus sp. MIMF12]|uniref:Uncharacterized protein n=1 Tax=Deinococcus rhizophilus TaxID=3049544 RepID=A0ABT7JJ40_9DEIO|nr:hypothetical protein [Deinococcus rhizophilus]MDL2345081.1 hypothetical protein [Deinococcus rhizophilus]
MRERLSDEDWDRLGQLERPYEPLTAPQAEMFAGELHAEVSEGHVLHGVDVQFLARRLGYDDFLAYAPDLEAPWVSVHLTWKPHEPPPWPSSYLYASLEDFLAER